MENPNNPKETEKPETDPSSPSPAEVESPTSSPPPPPPPPPSLSSSPSHEFSFTISFHAPNSLSGTTSAAAAAAVKLSKSSLSPLDLDLSPADDIFFNGHLLPLHFVSHRSSDVSIHNNNFFPHSHIETESVETSNTAAATGVSTTDYKGRSSSKSFPLVWLRKWLKGNDGEENRGGEKQRKKSIKKKVFDFAQLWKKYATLVEQLIFLKDWRDKREIRRSTQFSFSRHHRRRRRWQGGQSAPASIQTSPVNSGLLVTPPANNFSSEELHNAIQAAIVHCKNSIAVEGG